VGGRVSRFSRAYSKLLKINTSVKAFREQQTLLTTINLAVLAALFGVHVGFLALLGVPSKTLLVILASRFIILVLELIWIQRVQDDHPGRVLAVYVNLTIALNIAFAFLASFYGGIADSHYSVLMVIPIITAAYYFSLAYTVTIAASAAILTFFEVWLFFRYTPPVDISEYFEAATVSLIFLVVGLITSFLVRTLRREEEMLNRSLTEVREMQEKLISEEKLAAVGRLSSSVAHEIRNPVAMIASSLAMASKHGEGSPIRQEMLDIAARESRRLEELTSDFLLFGRRREPELKDSDVTELLEYVRSLTKARSQADEIEIEVECPAGLTAAFDPEQVQRALLNLMLNAADACPQGEKVSLTADADGNDLLISVINPGEPIPDEQAAMIFEPFITTKGNGTGLGLSIVRNIARSHGGDVRLAMNGPDAVAFELRLPLKHN